MYSYTWYCDTSSGIYAVIHVSKKMSNLVIQVLLGEIEGMNFKLAQAEDLFLAHSM